MVVLWDTALRVGRSVSQWAEATRMARGRGSLPPSVAKKWRAGLSMIAVIGEPWLTKMAGNMPPL